MPAGAAVVAGLEGEMQMEDVKRRLEILEGAIRGLREEMRLEILESVREYQARIDASESSRALLVKQIRQLAQYSVVRPYANQLLCTMGEPCVAEEDAAERRLRKLLEEIARLASQPERGLI